MSLGVPGVHKNTHTRRQSNVNKQTNNNNSELKFWFVQLVFLFSACVCVCVSLWLADYREQRRSDCWCQDGRSDWLLVSLKTRGLNCNLA